MITRESIEKVIEATEIISVVEKFVKLKPSGVNHTGCCPFHDEKTASFVVNKTKQIFKCFGCGKGGSAVTFIMEHEKLSFPDAIKYLADEYRIDLVYDTVKEDELVIEEKEGIMKINAYALKEYSKQTHPYITSRFTPEDIIQWKIGFAPANSKFITTPAINAGLYEFGIKSGLLGEKSGQGYDRFRQRVIFPIFNAYDECIGFGGRQLPDANAEYAKYINSSDSRVYNKSKVLYGINYARKAIVEHKLCYLVEGYADVIAMHRNNYENTVAKCGTSLTSEQAKIIKKLCNTVVIVADNDYAKLTEEEIKEREFNKKFNSGLKAAIAAIPIFLAEGMVVNVLTFDEHKDVDEYFADKTIATLPKYYDAVIWSVERFFKDAGTNPVLKTEAITQTVELLKKVKNEILRDEYLKTVSKQFKLKEKDLAKLLQKKEEVVNKQEERKFSMADWFEWPDELENHKDEMMVALDRDGVCVFENCVYTRRYPKKERPYITQISNYNLIVIQHMFNESMPKKLVKITNYKGDVKIFDVESDAMNTIRGVDKAVTGFGGDFLFWGTEGDFQTLRKKWFGEMGVGKMIEQLGYQPEGIWAFNNAIVKTDGSVFKFDDQGVFTDNEASYYVPSANKIYRMNHFKFQPQKKVILMQAEFDFATYCRQMKIVHREHSITGILYTISCIFSDLIYEKLKGFPLVFLHGVASTGKDNMIMACQSIFGHPQAPLNLGNGASTMKAQIRKFAQFTNMLINLAEYRRGDKKLNEYLKGLWGRDGYERGNIDSKFGTDTMPILSGVIVTGNEYPDDDPLVSRMVVEEFHKTDFTADEKKEYKRLTNMSNSGVSSYLVDIFRHRDLWVQKFPEFQARAESEIKADMKVFGANERTFQNYGVIGASFLILREHINFPFSWAEVLKHLTNCIAVQVRKQASGGKVMKFWDTFLSCVRTKNDPILHYQDFRVKGDVLAIQMRSVYGRMQAEWFRINNEPAPPQSQIVELLEQDEAFLEKDASYRYGHGRDADRSSALLFSLKATGIEKELASLIQYVGTRVSDTDGGWEIDTTPKPHQTSIFDKKEVTNDDEAKI